jgi:hypothetical protein
VVLAAELVVVFKEHQTGFDNVEVGEGIKGGVEWVR